VECRESRVRLVCEGARAAPGTPSFRSAFVPADESIHAFVGDRADKPRLLGYSESMPLYFFNFIRASKSETRPFKNDGLELVDNDAAWEEATTACGEKLREMDGSLRPGDGWNLEVTDAGGKAIFALKFTTESSGGGT
jgi:hypothetical protein